MKKILGISMYILLLLSCKTSAKKEDPVTDATIGNKFIDAFYSFDKDSLQTLLGKTDSTKQNMLFYQEWARCANYKVMKRNEPVEKNDSTIIFPITVKDDLMTALAIAFNVTDSFHIRFKDQQIISISTSSNDLPAYDEAMAWVKKNRPRLVDEPCKRNDAGELKACDCVLGMIKGFEDFTKKEK